MALQPLIYYEEGQLIKKLIQVANSLSHNEHSAHFVSHSKLLNQIAEQDSPLHFLHACMDPLLQAPIKDKEEFLKSFYIQHLKLTTMTKMLPCFIFQPVNEIFENICLFFKGFLLKIQLRNESSSIKIIPANEEKCRKKFPYTSRV